MKNIFTINLRLSKRTNYFIAVCIFTSILLNSCKKSDIVEEEIKPIIPKCLLTKIAFPNSPYFADFEYNSLGQIISVNNQLESSEFYQFEYDVKGNCIRMKTYQGSRSNQQKLMDDFTIKYDDKNFLTEYIINNGPVHSVKLNDKKQVIELSGKEGTFVEKVQFEYNTKGYLIKKTVFEREKQTEIASVYEYVYDDKKIHSIIFHLSLKTIFSVIGD